MTNFTIKVTSDTVCAWCYIGRKQLQKAQKIWLEKYPEDTFTITYLPYQLNPERPRGPGHSTSKHDFYVGMFGEARAAQFRKRLEQVGEPLGINFKYGGQTGNTRDSHRLVHLSKKYGGDAESKALDGLFAAYFEKEQDITDYNVLKDIAIQAGIPESDFQRAVLDSDEGGPEVDKAIHQSRVSGITSVPDYFIQDRYRVPGAIDPSIFVKVFEQMKEDGKDV